MFIPNEPLRAITGARRTAVLTGVAVLAAIALSAVGAGLAAVGTSLSPALMVVPVLLPVAAAAVLARPVLAPALVILAIPVAETDLPGPFPVQLIDAVVIGGVVLVALNRLSLGRPPLRWVPAAWWSVGLVTAAGLSLATAVDPGAAVKQVLILATGALLSLGVVSVVDRRLDLHTLVATATAVGAGICLASLPSAGALRASFDGAVVDNRARSIFADPNELGCFAAVILFLSVGLYLGAATRRGRLLSAVAVAAAGSALVLSLSRGAWLGATFGLVTLAVLIPSVRRRLLLLGLAGGAALAVLLVTAPAHAPAEVVAERLSTLEDPLGNPYDERPTVWRTAVRLIGEQPLLGVGPAGFPRASLSGRGELASVPAHAHNILLTVAVEAGLPAAGLLLGLFVTVGALSLRTVRRLPRTGDQASAGLIAGAAAGIGVFAGQGLVDYTLRNATILLLAWVLVGLVLAGDHLVRRQAAGSPGGGSLIPGRDVRARVSPGP